MPRLAVRLSIKGSRFINGILMWLLEAWALKASVAFVMMALYDINNGSSLDCEELTRAMGRVREFCP